MYTCVFLTFPKRRIPYEIHSDKLISGSIFTLRVINTQTGNTFGEGNVIQIF